MPTDRTTHCPIRIPITPAAFEAITATLPLGSVGFEAEVDARGSRLIWIEEAVANRLRAMRWPSALFRQNDGDPGRIAVYLCARQPKLRCRRADRIRFFR
jgi:hypothetical protein